MFEVKLSTAAKRFQYEWIFRNLDLHLQEGKHLAVVGSNGSGKSTFLKCLSGQIPLTEGKADFLIEGKAISESDKYKYLCISAPYLELPEEFSLLELLEFHFKFKNPIKGMDFGQMMDIMYLKEHQNKPVSQFSSGMKQRLKLGLCFFSEVPLLLLDEPTSNLDARGADWYQSLVRDYGKDRCMIICSNEPKEYAFCSEVLAIEDYKLKQKL